MLSFVAFGRGNLSLILQPGTHATLDTTVTVPISVYPDSYYVTARVVWQYLDPASDTWQYGASDPLVVNPVITILRPNLSLRANPSALTIPRGSTGTLTVSLVAPSGFMENLTLSHQTTPAGFTIIFSPNFVSPTRDSTIIISVDTIVLPGSYDIIVSGFGLYLAPTLDILVIVPGSTIPDFSITPSAASTSFDSGSSFKTSFTITPTNAFTGDITLAISNPSNLSCSLDQASIQTSGTTMLSCTGDTLGDYIVTITATSGSISHQATLRAHVAPSPPITTNNASLPLLGITPIFLVELVGVAIALMAIAGLAIIVVSRRRRPTWQTIR
jgi:uncharacterized membrane protein